MKWIFEVFPNLIVTGMTFLSSFAFAGDNDLSKCVRILSPYIDIAFAVPGNPVGIEEAQQIMKNEPKEGLPKEKMTFTNIRVLRQGIYLGYLAFYEGKAVLLQDSIERMEHEAFEAGHINGRIVPFVGYLNDVAGPTRPVRVLLPGLGLIPAYRDRGIRAGNGKGLSREAIPRFTRKQIILFEELLQRLELTLPIHIFPDYNAKNMNEIVRQILLATKFVFRDDEVLLEKIDFSWFVKNDGNGFEIGRNDSLLRPASWANWLRGYLIRQLHPDDSDFYRLCLWTLHPATAISLDLLNMIREESSLDTEFYPRLSEREKAQLEAITKNFQPDRESPYTRPQNLKFDKKKLKYHFKKHGVDLQTTTVEDYEKKAIRFISRKPVLGRLYQIRPDGDIALFSFFTDEFAVFTKDGIIRTYYKPKNDFHGREINAAYFLKDLYESWIKNIFTTESE